MKRAISVLLICVLLVSLFTGCAEKGDLSIVHGETAQITLSKEYETLVWQSSDEAVATVEDGAVTGTGPGTAVITALQEDKAVAEYTVEVTIVEITDLFLQATELELEIGESTVLSYSLFPTDASHYGLSYTSINPEIATVDQAGNVTGVAAGKTNIVLSTASGITAACEVTVKEPSPIDQLNDEERRLFDYLTQTAFHSLYNASGARFRNIYTIKATKEGYEYSASSYMIGDIQGTNKLGGTIHRYFIMIAPSESSSGVFWQCVDTFYPDDTHIEMPMDVINYIKINAALDEYWGVTSVAH